jgi:hypothetical protein
MSHSVDETYAVYDERHVRARKPHRCDACEETIERGHRYWRIGIVWDGARTVRRCERCQAMHQHLRTLCLGSYDDMWPDERLRCGTDYRREWDRDPPAEIAALAFATPEEMQR